MLSVLLSIIVLSTNISSFEQTKVHKKSIIETKKETQNIILLLDKIIGDGIADSIFSNTCVEDSSNVISNINSYISTIDNEFSDCTITINSVTESAGEYTTDYTVNCIKNIPDVFNVEIIQNKTVSRSANVTLVVKDCRVEIIDEDVSPAVTDFTNTGTIP